MESIFIQAAQLGSTVFITVVFIFYLFRRDVQAQKRDEAHALALSKVAESNIIFSRSLQKLTDVIEQNSNVNVKKQARLKKI